MSFSAERKQIFGGFRDLNEAQSRNVPLTGHSYSISLSVLPTDPKDRSYLLLSQNHLRETSRLGETIGRQDNLFPVRTLSMGSTKPNIFGRATECSLLGEWTIVKTCVRHQYDGKHERGRVQTLSSVDSIGHSDQEFIIVGREKPW